MTWAICFFGLTRSLRRCWANLEWAVFEPLRKAGIEFQVYVHTYNLEILTNFRSHEFGCRLDPEEVHLFDKYSAKILQTRQDDLTPTIKPYLSWPNPWPDDPTKNSMRNVLRQLHSIHQVYELAGTDHSGYVFLRPDSWYYQPLNLTELKIRSRQIKFPSWGSYGGYNDRAAIAGPQAAAVYASRWTYVLAQKHPLACSLHAETLLHHVITNHKLEVKLWWWLFARVRATGRVEPEYDTTFLEQLKKLGLKAVTQL